MCLCALMLGITAAVLAGGEARGALTAPVSAPSTGTIVTAPLPPVTAPPPTAPTTAVAPGPGYPAPAPPAPAPPAPKVALRLPARSLTASRRGVVTVPLACPAASSSACTGAMVLEYRPPASRRAEAGRRGRKVRLSRRGRKLRAARAPFVAAPAHTVKVGLRLSRRSRRLLERRGRVRMRLEATTKLAGRRRTVSRRVTVKISRRGRRTRR